MNSKQRRRDKKLWKYEVNLTYEQVDRNGYDNMFDWCRDTFGNNLRNGGWREKHGHYGTCWQFKTQERATVFTLRWL
jgi:hypothetical protein